MIDTGLSYSEWHGMFSDPAISCEPVESEGVWVVENCFDGQEEYFVFEDECSMFSWPHIYKTEEDACRAYKSYCQQLNPSGFVLD